MKLDISSGPMKDKQTLVAVVLVVVIVIAVGWMVYSNFFANRGTEAPIPQQDQTATDPAMMPPDQMPPADVSSEAPPPPAPAAPAPTAPTQPAAQSSAGGAKSITVFGGVVITYPEKWGIDLRSSGSSAVITDGNGRFEVHPPNPSATTAREIADAALETFANNGKVTSQGDATIAGHSAYKYSVSIGGSAMKIVGVDAPIRIVILERAKSGSLGAYSAAFDKLENGLQFR
ncbi:MAG: hypothetical protein ACOX3G_10920 [Armatimonadota bacterium]|jgi:hypothetical protein